MTFDLLSFAAGAALAAFAFLCLAVGAPPSRRREFQPTTQADEPKLPDGSAPVSGVQRAGLETLAGIAAPDLRGYQPQPRRCGRVDAHKHGEAGVFPCGDPCQWPMPEAQHPPSGASAVSAVTAHDIPVVLRTRDGLDIMTSVSVWGAFMEFDGRRFKLTGGYLVSASDKEPRAIYEEEPQR